MAHLYLDELAQKSRWADKSAGLRQQRHTQAMLYATIVGAATIIAVAAFFMTLLR